MGICEKIFEKMKSTYAIAEGRYLSLTGSQQKLVMITLLFALTVVFLFLLGDKTANKIGVLANVVIAGIVCYFQYSEHRKDTNDKRKKEGQETCALVIGNIIRYAKRTSAGDIDLDSYIKTAPTPDGRYHSIQWQFRNSMSSGEITFGLIVGHFTDSTRSELTGNFESIEFAVKSGIPYSGLYQYQEGQKGEVSIESRKSVRWNDLSKREWEVLMLCVLDILKDSNGRRIQKI